MSTTSSSDRIPPILVMVATIATIIFNGIAAAGYVNGVTPAEITDKYPTLLTPAGYAFSIWTLIYIGLIAFSLYQLLPLNLIRFRKVRSLYVVSCVLNCSWIYSWHHDYVGICLVIILALLATLMLILIVLLPDEAGPGVLFTKIPFGIYAGWVTAASLVNFAVFLSYEQTPIAGSTWSALGAALILLASVVAVIVRWRLRNYVFPLSVAWAATAIAVKQSGNTSIVVACAISVIACLVLSVSFVMDQKTFNYENR
jgi:benzodiazapine receptor